MLKYKVLLLIIVEVFLANLTCFAANWMQIYNPKVNAANTYLDKDSIKKYHTGYLFAVKTVKSNKSILTTFLYQPEYQNQIGMISSKPYTKNMNYDFNMRHGVELKDITDGSAISNCLNTVLNIAATLPAQTATATSKSEIKNETDDVEFFAGIKTSDTIVTVLQKISRVTDQKLFFDLEGTTDHKIFGCSANDYRCNTDELGTGKINILPKTDKASFGRNLYYNILQSTKTFRINSYKMPSGDKTFLMYEFSAFAKFVYINNVPFIVQMTFYPDPALYYTRPEECIVLPNGIIVAHYLSDMQLFNFPQENEVFDYRKVLTALADIYSDMDYYLDNDKFACPTYHFNMPYVSTEIHRYFMSINYNQHAYQRESGDTLKKIDPFMSDDAAYTRFLEEATTQKYIDIQQNNRMY